MSVRRRQSNTITSNTQSDEQLRDLGFGTVVSNEDRNRLLNPDGSFNVDRAGLNFWSSMSAYHWFLTISWTKFLAVVVVAYLALNSIFAIAFVMCGPGAMHGVENSAIDSRFLQAFFFSVQTFATIGYGHISPSGLLANILVTAESLVGLIGLAFATGILFARFSRPTAKILFSQHAIIAPYNQGTAFEFRILNARKNQLIEVAAKVLFARFENENGRLVRKFNLLNLEREKVTFLPLHWTIVHPIDEESPIYGLTEKEFYESGVEFVILLTAIDETFSQSVYARSSYYGDEVIWNAKFSDIFDRPPGATRVMIDVTRLHAIERLGVENSQTEEIQTEAQATIVNKALKPDI
ncbi:MAG: ion channel [Pyrinomonadaceae bacterium]